MADQLTDAEIARIRELHATGMSRNDIARTIGRSARVVSKYAERLGLDFDREQTREATAAKVADAKARRAELQLKLLDDAERLRGQMFAPVVAFSFGGKDNRYEEHPIPEPVFADKHKIMMAVSAAITASIKIDEHDRNSETASEFDAWLTEMKGTGE